VYRQIPADYEREGDSLDCCRRVRRLIILVRRLLVPPPVAAERGPTKDIEPLSVARRCGVKVIVCGPAESVWRVIVKRHPDRCGTRVLLGHLAGAGRPQCRPAYSSAGVTSRAGCAGAGGAGSSRSARVTRLPGRHPRPRCSRQRWLAHQPRAGQRRGQDVQTFQVTECPLTGMDCDTSAEAPPRR
jgi:hypothetical protein